MARAAALLFALAPVPAGAVTLAIPPELRQTAATCLAEALRLCPNALAAEDHGLGCVRAGRRKLSAPCRGLYEQAARVLAGGDLHLVLRPPKKR